jgi:hypothetical protein
MERYREAFPEDNPDFSDRSSFLCSFEATTPFAVKTDWTLLFSMSRCFFKLSYTEKKPQFSLFSAHYRQPKLSGHHMHPQRPGYIAAVLLVRCAGTNMQ